MSLINQMLRDLERRNHAGPTSPPPQRTLEIKLTPPQPRGGYRHAAWLAICLTVGGLWWFRQDQAVTPTAPVAPVVQVTPQPTLPPPVPSATSNATPEPAEPIAADIAAEPTSQSAVAATSPVTATPVLPAAGPDKPTQAVPAVPAVSAIPPPPSQPLTPSSEKPARKQPVEASRRAESLYRQAENSASLLMQQEYLREALQVEPRYLPARQKLLGILAREPSSVELKQFLDESLTLFPGNLGFITTLAHYHVQQKDFAAAVNILERVDYYGINDTQYLGLLAAAYQQQQRCDQALPIYQKLSLLQPEKAEHWLGLGICAEKQQQPGNAAQAYQQALAKNSLSPQVVDYIKQRLNALTR